VKLGRNCRIGPRCRPSAGRTAPLRVWAEPVPVGDRSAVRPWLVRTKRERSWTFGGASEGRPERRHSAAAAACGCCTNARRARWIAFGGWAPRTAIWSFADGRSVATSSRPAALAPTPSSAQQFLRAGFIQQARVIATAGSVPEAPPPGTRSEGVRARAIGSRALASGRESAVSGSAPARPRRVCADTERAARTPACPANRGSARRARDGMAITALRQSCRARATHAHIHG
jgi:hypothetical protein